MKKRNFAKKLLLSVALCAIFMLCFGCGVFEDDEQVAIAEKLSTVFVGTEYELPDDWRMNSGFLPEYNDDTGSFLVYAEKSEDEEDENGSVFRRYSGGFFSVNSDGSVAENLTFVMPKHSEYVLAGRLSENFLYMITFEHDGLSNKNSYLLHRINRNNGEVSSTEINTYFTDVGAPEKILFDADENIYLYGNGKAVSLTSDFVYRFSAAEQTQIKSIAEGADGSIWICAYDRGVLCVEKIDTENGNITASYELNDMESRTFLSAPRECEYDFYFADNSNLYGAKVDEEGEFVKTPIIGLINSGILNDSVVSGGRYDFTASPIAAFENGTFLFMRLNSEKKKMNPALYSRAKQTEPDEIRTINIAYARQPFIEYTEAILRFKQEHPEVLINILDYTVYEGEGAWDSAADKLAFDIANGFVKPDLVIGKTSGADIDLLYRNSMYTDLTPYLQADENVNFDTLFGCIPRVFDDGNGGMWGICTQFEAKTLLSTREMLGEYGQNGYWTLDEMLDFLDSLPDTVEGSEEANSDYPDVMLHGCSAFYDRKSNTCSFDSEEFQRYLAYIAELPKNRTEAKRLSAYSKMSGVEQYYARMTGQIGLVDYTIWGKPSLLKYKVKLGRDDVVPIGYATVTDSGIRVLPDITCVITSFSEDPDMCWELISDLCEIREIELYSCIPSLKTVVEEYMEKMKDYDLIYALGSDTVGNRKRDPENPLTEEDFSYPVIIFSVDESGWREVFDLLDNAGYPIADKIPADAEEIVSEEISAFLAGMGSAEECAKKIQSRVNILLAEKGE